MTEQRKITRFKYLNSSVEIGYTLQRTDTPNKEEHLFQSNDEPTLVLKDALQNLAKHSIKILELKKDAEIEITGFSLKYDLDENDTEYFRDCVITTKYKLKDTTGVVALNIPKRTESNVEDGQLMPKGLANDLRDLIYFIEQYLDGERVHKQFDFFDASTKEQTQAAHA